MCQSNADWIVTIDFGFDRGQNEYIPDNNRNVINTHILKWALFFRDDEFWIEFDYEKLILDVRTCCFRTGGNSPVHYQQQKRDDIFVRVSSACDHSITRFDYIKFFLIVTRWKMYNKMIAKEARFSIHIYNSLYYLHWPMSIAIYKYINLRTFIHIFYIFLDDSLT